VKQFYVLHIKWKQNKNENKDVEPISESNQSWWNLNVQ